MFYWFRRRPGAALMVIGCVVFANAFSLVAYSTRLINPHGMVDSSLFGEINRFARHRVGVLAIADIAIGLGVLGLVIFFAGVWRATNRPAGRRP
jgi:hypothetical protein